MVAVLLIAFWVACGVLAGGVFQAFLWNEFKSLRSDREWRSNAGLSAVIGIFGPAGLLMVFVLTGFAQDGLMYRRPKP